MSLRLAARQAAISSRRSWKPQSQWLPHGIKCYRDFSHGVQLKASLFPQRPITSMTRNSPPVSHSHSPCRRTFFTESLPPVLIPPTIFLMCFLGLWSYKVIMTIVFQNKIIYMPYMPPFARSEKMEDYTQLCRPVDWHEISIRSLDGTRIALCVGEIQRGRFQEATPEKLRPKRTVIIYFQGNGGSIPLRLPMLSGVLKALNRRVGEHSMRFTLVAPSYRGFWKSRGRASQRGIERDAKATLEWVRQAYGNDANIVFWGQSLGAGVAANLAAWHVNKPPAQTPTHRSKIAGMVLETPFIGIKEMLLALYPQKWLPYRYLWPFLRNFWDSDEALREIAMSPRKMDLPIQIITAGSDEVVPANQADHLHILCEDLKLDVRRKDITGSLHNEVPDRVQGRETIAAFISEVEAESSVNFTTSPKDCKCSGSFPHIGSKKIDLSVQDSQPQHHHLAIYTVAGPYSSTSYAFAMLLQKPQPISIRQSTPVTSTTLYSPGRCVSSTSSPVLVNEPWNQTRTASLRRTETRSSDHSSVDSPTRTSWDSGFSDGASSNTSINELSAGLDKNIAQRIEAEVDRISMEIAQSNHLHDGLQSQQAASPAANEADYALPVPHVQDVSLALTDPSVLGDPIFMSTAGFEVGPAGLRIGHCSYLNLPAGDDCTLRIIGPDCAGSRPRFQLIISTTILDMRTTDKSWKLSSIHDVTEIINEMATDRLSYDLNIQSTSTRGNGQDVAPKHLKKMKSWDEPFDWNKFTEDESATHDQQPEGPSSPDSLNTPDDITSFIQSANLLKSQTKKFFILTPRQLEHRKRNIIEVFRRKKSIWAVEIASLVVSFVSNDLLHEPHVVDRLSNHLRRCTADSVTKCFGGSEGFEWRATLRAGTETVINCFPIDNDRDGMAREVWWVCFVET